MADDLQRSRRNRIDLKATDKGIHAFAEALVEEYGQGRKKAYSEAERTEYLRHFDLVLTDLLSASQEDPDLYVGYSRRMEAYGRRGSYWNHQADTAAISKTYYLGAIGFLHAGGWVEDVPAKSGYGGISSRMRATDRLREAFSERKLSWASITADLALPQIIVKDDDGRPMSWPEPVDFDLEGAIATLARINENLQRTFINLDISDEQHAELRERFVQTNSEAIAEATGEYRESLDFSKRTLRRIFARKSFSTGGRFYGGWWQGVPSSLRKHIEIDGAVTVEMDYSSMQPCILYAKAGHPAKPDAYILPDWGPALRPMVKKLFSQLLNSDESSRSPRQWHRFSPDVDVEGDGLTPHQRAKAQREAFREQTGREYSELIADLLAFHEPIVDRFFSKAWGEMQRVDSDIAEHVMTALLNAEVPITALPIHDSFIVRRGVEPTLKVAMMEAFAEIVGTQIGIGREDAVWDGPQPAEGLVFAEQPHKDALKHMETHRRYHQREFEWQQVWGPID